MENKDANDCGGGPIRVTRCERLSKQRKKIMRSERNDRGRRLEADEKGEADAARRGRELCWSDI